MAASVRAAARPRYRLDVGVADDETSVPVDGGDGRQAQLGQGAGHAEDGGDLERPREDGHVARPASRLGHNGLNPLAVHGDHVRGQQVAGNEDDVFREVVEAGPLALEKMAQDAPRDVLDVGDPFAQRRILGLPELVRELALDVHDDFFDVDQRLLERALDPLMEVGIVQHEEVGLEDRRLLVAGLYARLVPERAHLDLGFCHGREEARPFCPDFRGIHRPRDHRRGILGREEEGVRDRYAGRRGNAA